MDHIVSEINPMLCYVINACLELCEFSNVICSRFMLILLFIWSTWLATNEKLSVSALSVSCDPISARLEL